MITVFVPNRCRCRFTGLHEWPVHWLERRGFDLRGYRCEVEYVRGGAVYVGTASGELKQPATEATQRTEGACA
jgi:hypothetical protein